jgi:hypothetical protein
VSAEFQRYARDLVRIHTRVRNWDRIRYGLWLAVPTSVLFALYMTQPGNLDNGQFHAAVLSLIAAIVA